MPDYDLIVIGAGTAGKNAAKAAARLGAKTALVEEDGYGGTCLATG
jgi:pyruvate/2-oxoglutarate dehydrogenase complex dihydrolipoamide dehydrogenase (E3) component